MLKVLTRQSIQRNQIFIFRTKGSTFATEQSNNLISPMPNFGVFKIGKLSWILSLDLHWGFNPPTHDHLSYTWVKQSLAILKTIICSTALWVTPQDFAKWKTLIRYICGKFHQYNICGCKVKNFQLFSYWFSIHEMVPYSIFLGPYSLNIVWSCWNFDQK